MFKKATIFSGLLTTGLFLTIPLISVDSTVHAQYSLYMAPPSKIEGLTFLSLWNKPNSELNPFSLNLVSAFDTPQITNPTPPQEIDITLTPPLSEESTQSAIPDPITLQSTTSQPKVDSDLNQPADTSSVQTPESTNKPTATPSPKAEVKKGGLNADKIFEMVNDHRKTLNLPVFQKDDRACTLAASRAPEINTEIAKDIMHRGLRDRDLDYWNSENIISMNSEQAAFNWWIHDKIHKDAIEGDYKYSCVACSGLACAEEFTNFQPK